MKPGRFVETEAAARALEIGDPFLFFERQAYAYQGELLLPAEFIPQAVDIVKGAFHEEWLRERVRAKTRRSVLPFSDHLLGNCFAIAGPDQIVEVMELAVYIKRLSRVAGLTTVVRNMQEDYWPGLLQLAFAYRFHRVGASGLELEPPAAAGRKADIFFELSGTAYLVECYTPRAEHRDTSQELQRSTRAIFEALGEDGDRVRRVCIRLTRPIEATDRKRIQRATIDAIRKMGDRQRVEAQDDAAHISVEDISEMVIDTDFPPPEERGRRWIYGDADWGVNGQAVPVSEIPAIRRGTATFQRGDRIFVWRAPGESTPTSFEERVEELADKIGDKLTQTRREDGPGRIVVASIPEALGRDYDTMRLLGELRVRLLRRHRGVAGLFLTSRVWTRQKRHQYRGYLLGSDEARRFPKQAFDRLQELEGKTDVLEDWR